MSLPDYDEIILGQGLAGTTLAWSLRWLGRRVLVIDRDQSVTSSRIAAGLITPVTGQRLVKSWRWDEFWPAAVAFYRRVETECGLRFFESQQIVRLLTNDVEQEFLAKRLADESAELISNVQPPLHPDWFRADPHSFQMNDAARLNVAAFLDASRKRFVEASQFVAADVDLNTDVELTSAGIRLRRLDVTARRMIFCQGIDAIDNPWFRHVRFNPAKGEILTLRIDGLSARRCVQRGVWLMPLGNDLFRAGATYEWNDLSAVPTSAGRDEICSRLREFLRLPFDVVKHDAAIRPILLHQYPALGLHPRYPQLGYFNGLGSKGSLQAPWLAEHLAAQLASGQPFDEAVGLNQYPESKRATPRPPTLTALAQAAVRDVLHPGDVAIDATAGNGHDTLFLAGCVGPAGRVYSFDIQQAALSATAQRAQDAGFENITLLHRSHAEMTAALPDVQPGEVSAIMFNLGYLPGGEKQLTTQAETSVSAIVEGLRLLKKGGIMTIVAYPGHDTGAVECDAVQRLLSGLGASEFEVHEPTPANEGRKASPRLFTITCRAEPSS